MKEVPPKLRRTSKWDNKFDSIRYFAMNYSLWAQAKWPAPKKRLSNCEMYNIEENSAQYNERIQDRKLFLLHTNRFVYSFPILFFFFNFSVKVFELIWNGRSGALLHWAPGIGSSTVLCARNFTNWHRWLSCTRPIFDEGNELSLLWWKIEERKKTEKNVSAKETIEKKIPFLSHRVHVAHQFYSVENTHT